VAIRAGATVLAVGLLQAGLLGCGGDMAARLEARKRENPIPYGVSSIRRGQALYAAQCEFCHGRTGAGDGPGALAIEGGVGDLVERGALLKPGSVAYKIEHGVGAMPAFGGMLTSDQIWDLTNYVRSLSSPQASQTQSDS